MLLLISPSRTLDFSPQSKVKSATSPEFVDEAGELIGRLRKLSKKKIAQIMGVSEKLAAKNFHRFRSWSPRHTAENSKPSVLAYRGDVYDGLAADNWPAADFTFAQRLLRQESPRADGRLHPRKQTEKARADQAV